MYTLKSTLRRGVNLSAVVALAVGSVLPAVLPASAAYADALNPLTERSLTLSSSSPGWSFTDGSGNSTYAPPNSGANGKKTGETFTFKVSTDSASDTANKTIKAMSFQYCTASAGLCYGPTGGAGAQEVDLDVVADGTQVPAEISSTTWDIIKPGGTGRAEVQSVGGLGGTYTGAPKMDNSEGNFVVLVGGTYSAGWSMETVNLEDAAGVGTPTTKNNFIRLVNSTGVAPAAGTQIKVIFFGNDYNYITNPGAGSFFVKINTFNSDTTADIVPGSSHIIDGGVTVANVMNQSIEIQTKVLETMQFSVGTVDPNTLDATQLAAATSPSQSAHTPCDPILTGMTAGSASPNVLKMGDQAGENSLSSNKTYSTHSYWRLSSNSSAGATVYYSGVTLSNTVGDQIDPINNGNGTLTTPVRGAEQFGLALANGTGPNYPVNYSRENHTGNLFEDGADNAAAGLVDLATDEQLGTPTGVPTGIHTTTISDVGGNASYHTPRLFPLVPKADYAEGAGYINSEYSAIGTQARFAFDKDSNTVPTPIADESSQVVDCVTGKMRYMANIAATTPAGIYTTKINYIAAPQY